MKFRFSIRDLLWLVIVVALAVGWWVDHQRLSPPPPPQFRDIDEDGSIKVEGPQWMERVSPQPSHPAARLDAINLRSVVWTARGTVPPSVRNYADYSPDLVAEKSGQPPTSDKRLMMRPVPRRTSRAMRWTTESGLKCRSGNAKGEKNKGDLKVDGRRVRDSRGLLTTVGADCGG